MEVVGIVWQNGMLKINRCLDQLTYHCWIERWRRNLGIIHPIFSSLQDSYRDVGILCQSGCHTQSRCASTDDHKVIMLREKLIDRTEGIGRGAI
jgi:hypothetical protein